jgi:hypothetical protein
MSGTFADVGIDDTFIGCLGAVLDDLGHGAGVGDVTMTTRRDFSLAEWELLGNAPLAAAAAVAVASPGGGAREASALIAGWREAGHQFPQDQLLQAIVTELDPQDREAQERSSGLQARGPRPTFDEIVDEAVDLCGQAIDLLTQVAQPQETEHYRAFVMHIITQVANATNESGFLGVGGQRISRPERGVLNEIAAALGTADMPQ